MARPLFSNVARIEIEGVQALRLLERTGERATYRVGGFRQPIIVHDYRPAGDSLTQRPAHVTIEPAGDQLLVQLRPTQKRDARYTLWIAVGLDEFVPQNDCVYDRFDFLDDDRFAFLALYKRPKRSYNEEEDYSFLTA